MNSEDEAAVINQHRQSSFGESAAIGSSEAFRSHYGNGALLIAMVPASSSTAPQPPPGEWLAFAVLRHMPDIVVGGGEAAQAFPCIGVCSVIAIQRGQGYGRQLMDALRAVMADEFPGYQALGFTKSTGFFARCAGWRTLHDFINAFEYVDPSTEEHVLDDDGDAFFLEPSSDLGNRLVEETVRLAAWPVEREHGSELPTPAARAVISVPFW